MNKYSFIPTAVCLTLFLAASTLLSQSPKLHEMKVGSIKLAPKIVPPNPDSTLIVVRSTIRDLTLESSMGERVQKIEDGVWHLHLYPGTQTISFNVPGVYKQETREYEALAKNRSYEVQISPKGKFPWMWVGLGTAVAGGGAFALLNGGGGTPPLPIEKLPDPPGGPTGN